MENYKKFLTYHEQIELLKSKGLHIKNEETAISFLKRFSYYSLVSGYKDIFKQNGLYRSDASIEHIVNLYLLDDYLRNIILHNVIILEKHIKSLYSYSFCEIYGDRQGDYLNVTNYNYGKYRDKVTDLVTIIKNNIIHSDRFPYVHHHMEKYGEVPLWVIAQTMTFGNMSKMYTFSEEKLQSRVARNFKDVYGGQLSAMLNVTSKFRNVCAHGERLYNFKTKSSIPDLPIHREIRGQYSISKNDLFNLCISFKYLLAESEFSNLVDMISSTIDVSFDKLNDFYRQQILKSMGFPQNWEEILRK